MASKVNTKLVVFLVLLLGLATAIIGGLYVLNLRHNAGRSVRIGDEALAAGDLDKAHSYYGRAVSKEPSNMAYLEKLEKVVVQLKPTTADRAVELYKERLGLLSHAARFNSSDPATHLRFLDELVRDARLTLYGYQWDMVNTAADDMINALASNDPKRHLGQMYKTMATYRLQAQRTPEQLSEARRELDAAIKAMPDNDLAWATLVYGMRVELEKYRSESRSREAINQQIREIDETLASAVKAVPNGPEITRMQLMQLSIKRELDKDQVSDAQVKQAADRLVSLLTDEADEGLVSESVEPLWAVPGDGLQRAINLLTKRVQSHPNELDMHIGAARLAYLKNDLELAEREAKYIMNAETLPASFMSQLQFELRRLAAGLVVDIQNRRWMAAPQEQRAALLKATEDARAKLSEYVTDAESDNLMLQADGKIAFAKADYNRAAQCLEKLIKDPAALNYFNGNEVLMLSAISLQRVGQIGLAYERLNMALDRAPGNAILIVEKARIEAALGDFKMAAATIKTLPATEFDKADIRQLIEQINANAASGTPITLKEDPDLTALASANASILKGDIDTARTTVLAALQLSPESFSLLQRMIEIEGSTGHQDRAQEFLARAKALRPDDLELKRLETLLKYTDPIDAMRELNNVVNTNELDRATTMMINLTALQMAQDSYARRTEALGNLEAVAKSRELSARAKAEAVKYADQVEKLAPDDRSLLEFRFNDALMSKDWPRAEIFAAKAKAMNADQADGMFYRGRLELLKGNLAEAIRSLEATTSKLDFSAQAWRTLGLAYESQPNYSQAQRAYEQAYKCNPNDLETIRRYVSVLRRAAQNTRALGILRKIHEVAPDDADLRDQWLDMEAHFGDKSLAMRSRSKMYADNAKDRQNAFRLAALLGELEPTRELILDSKGDAVVSEMRWSRMTAQERELVIKQAKTDWYKASDAILDQLASIEKDELSVVVLKATLLRERGEVVEGEKVLQELIGRTEPSKRTAMMFLELGRYQARTNHFTEAIATLEDNLSLQDPKVREIDLELGLMYAQKLGKPGKAMEHLKAVQTVAPDRSVQSIIVECLYKQFKFDEAERRLNEIISSSGEDFVSTMLAAGIAEGRGDELWSKAGLAAAKGNIDQQHQYEGEAIRKYDQQREALARAESQQPSSPTPRILLAQSFLNEFNRTRKVTLLDDALQALERAERINAGVSDVSMMRVAVLKAKGDRKAAMGELERMLTSAPDDVQARRELIALYALTNDFDSALALIDDAIKINPTLALWHESKGDLYKMMRQKKLVKPENLMDMVNAYARAYDLSPIPLMMLKYAEANLSLPNPDYKGVVDRIAAHPKDLAGEPAIKELYSRALVGAGRREEAMTQAREAYVLRRQAIKENRDAPTEIGRWFLVLPSLFPAPPGFDPIPTAAALNDAEKFVLENCGGKPDVHEYRSLASMWLFMGDPKVVKALERIRSAISLCPEQDNKLLSDLNMELANYLLISGDFQAAADVYKTVTQKDPKNVAALNNMAFLMAENLNDPANALPYAERALELAPMDASIMDTVGWVYFLKGDNEKARQLFDKSIDKEEIAATRVHIAEMKLKSGDLDGALQQLEMATKKSPDMQTQQRISTLQDDIKKRRTPGQ